MEEPAFGAHPLHEIDSLAAKVARLRATLLWEIEHRFGPKRFRLVVHAALRHFRHFFRQLLGHGGNLIAASVARVQHTSFFQLPLQLLHAAFQVSVLFVDGFRRQTVDSSIDRLKLSG